MESVGKQKRRSKDKPSKHKARDQAITEDTPKGKRKKNHRGAPPPPTPPSDGSNTPPRAITAANQREIIEVAAELVASVPDPSIPVGASSQDDAETHTAFLRHHVQCAARIVSSTLAGKSTKQCTQIAIAYLDGYLTWLPYSERKAFMKELNDPKVSLSVSSDGSQAEEARDVLGEASSLDCGTASPTTIAELYLRLWRTLWTVTEQVAFCPNRLAQLFHRERMLRTTSPLYQLCVDPSDPEAVFHKRDLDVYLDGLLELERGKINFDDMDESARFGERAKNAAAASRGKQKFRKTFTEPEGLAAFIVALRNFSPIFIYNVYVAMLAWYWSEPTDITILAFVMVDAIMAGVQTLLDIIGRVAVFGGYRCCGYRSLPRRHLILLFLLHLASVAYFPAYYFLRTNPEIITIGVAAGVAFLRLLYNALLFFRFPYTQKGSWQGSTQPKRSKWNLAIKLVAFFVLCSGLLVPAHYLFLMPTLQRSAFWNFCALYSEAQLVQCYIGVLGLWIPLLAIILIINFIAYTIVLALYGALVANYKRIGSSSDEAYSTMRGFRTLSTLLHGWNKARVSGTDEFRYESTEITGGFLQVEEDMRKVSKIWYHIVDDLKECDIISSETATQLNLAHNLHDVHLRRTAREILSFFFTSLVGLPPDTIRKLAQNQHFLDDLPSLSQLIPSYGEAVIFDRAYLADSDNKKLSNLEFLVAKHRREWENFFVRMRELYGERDVASSSDLLLAKYLYEHRSLHPDVEDEIRIWASLRGQTLYRTVRGAMSYRMALRLLYENTGRSGFEAAHQCQLILAHQQYGDPSVLRKIASDMKLMLKKLSSPHFLGLDGYGNNPFDLVFDYNSREILKQEANREELLKRKQQLSGEFDRHSVKLIHGEVEQICNFGNALRRLVESHGEWGPAFPYASVRAGLPNSQRIPAVYLFRNNLGGSSYTKADGYASFSDGEDDFSEDGELPGLPKRESPWELLAKGPVLLHTDPLVLTQGWLRVFDVQSGRELSMQLRSQLFELRDLTSHEDRFVVLRFGMRTGPKKPVVSYAMVFFSHPPDLIRYHHESDEIEEIQFFLGKKMDPALRSSSQPFREASAMKSAMEIFSIEGCLLTHHPVVDDGIFLGIQVYDVLPRRNPLLLQVRGSMPFAEPERIQGKASNQLNGLKFAFGLAIQTKDANQGGTLAEAIKYPLVVSRFVKDRQLDPAAPAIIGFRESVFTRRLSTVGRMQAYAEWAFGTIIQRVLAKLDVRMHYGHPDFFSAPWVFSRSALSKANPNYNLSEDIFAGYIAALHDRRSTHTDRIQDEKGRDTSLASTYIFNAKISQGAASQLKTRDIFELNTRLDFLRQFLLFQSSLGYYFATALMLVSVKLYLFGLLLFTMAGFSAENLGNLGLIFSVPFLLQVGNFSLIPLVLEAYAEDGFWAVLEVIIDMPMSLIYFLFQSQTSAYHFIEAFLKGKSRYEATGRLLGVSRKTLIELYQSFGRSHYEVAIDYIYYIIAYYIVAESRKGGYIPLIAPMMAMAVYLLGPSIFQHTTSVRRVFAEVDSFGKWAFVSQTKNVLLKEWQRRALSEVMGRKLTGNAAFRLGFSRLQTYNIFNNLKTAMSSHWRVDLLAVLSNLLRVVLWVFICLSIPGTMKDIVMKVALLFLFYFSYSAVFTMTIGADNQHRWHTGSLFLWLLVVGLVVVQTFVLGLWQWFGFSIIGLFMSMKCLNAISWMSFHLYATICKMHSLRLWGKVNQRQNKGPLPNFDSKIDGIRSDLEQRLLSGLFMVDAMERPFLLFGIFAFVLPTFVVFNFLWHIPYLSDRLMFGISLRRRSALRSVLVADGRNTSWSPFSAPQPGSDSIDLPMERSDMI